MQGIGAKPGGAERLSRFLLIKVASMSKELDAAVQHQGRFFSRRAEDAINASFNCVLAVKYQADPGPERL